MKKCSICKETKEDCDFRYQNKAKGILTSACKECLRKKEKEFRKQNPEIAKQRDREAYKRQQKHRVEYARNYRKENPDKTMNSNLKTKYGITREEYFQKLEEQDYKCAICGKPQDLHPRHFAVDHNHKTGKVRGILCDGCNYGVGFLEKRKNEYEEYIKKYEEDELE